MSDTINSAGLALIKEWEGLRLTAYQCAAGVWTIGYGHTGTVDGKKIKKGMTITRAKADKLLQADVAEFWDYVNNPYYVPLIGRMGENQKAALTSFAFNCGANNLKTLCKNRSLEEIADAILLYNKAGGKVNAGLVARRKDERMLFLKDMEVTHDMDTIRNGDRGQQVRVLQILLNGSGHRQHGHRRLGHGLHGTNARCSQPHNPFFLVFHLQIIPFSFASGL